MSKRECEFEEIEKMVDNRCPSHTGILVNNCKGKKWVFIDETPILAVTYSYCVGGCGIFGKVTSREKIKDFLCDIFDDLKKRDITTFEFSCEEIELTKQILALFPERSIHTEMEYSYRCKEQKNYEVSRNIGENYKIIPIDTFFLNNISMYENQEIVLGRMRNSWEEKLFLKHSLGFVAINNNRIIGIIFGSARYKEYIPIDIEVEKQYRRNGIALNLTKIFITACQKQKYIPQWDCVESNVASQRLAEKTGFEIIKKRPYYWFEI